MALTKADMAEALFDAFSNGDADRVRELCSPDVTARLVSSADASSIWVWVFKTQIRCR